MKRGDKEFYRLMEDFEKGMKQLPIYIGGHSDRSKSERAYYDNGRINELFIAFMAGYQLAKCYARMEDLRLKED
jgi:hypothetical protein